MARIGADILLGLHFLWVLFMLLGFPLAWFLRSRKIRLGHALGLASYLLLAAVNWFCPLTLGEEALRRLAEPGFTYQGSFLAGWLERLIYVENWGAPLWIFRLLAGIYLVLVVSSWWWWPQQKKPGV